MIWKNTTERFGLISIGFHWLMFLLLVAVYACIELRELYPKGSDPREALKSWHFMLGLTVFILVWLRLLSRLLQTNPRDLSPPITWQAFAANMTHFTLYLLMISMPLMGWLILSAEGKPIPFYGMTVPSLVAENHDLAEFVEEIHETVGTFGYILIAFHTLAALFHHYLLKDGTLMRILSINRH
jgi:superoxide oxidase